MPNRPTFEPDLVVPSLPVRVFESLVFGVRYYRVVAEADGEFEGFEAPQTVFPFVKRQRFKVGEQMYTVWFPPDEFQNRVAIPGRSFRKGDVIISLKIKSGDRLFVDKFTYNFRRPKRGEIVVFETSGVEGLQQDTHYIKRLVGLSGERIRIGDDRHVVVDGERLDASTPRFENVYGFDPRARPDENQHSGHLNDVMAARAGRPGIAPRFPDGTAELKITPHHYLMMGDNTMSSADSRSWGELPQEKIVGKHCFVFWPISERFGWGVR
jgi:signal peptidase I